MIELTEFIEATTEVVVDSEYGTLTCKVRLNACSRQFLNDLREKEKKDAKVESDSDLIILEKMIDSWDIRQNGAVLPINVENLKKLPPVLINSIFNSVADKRDELKKLKESASSST